MSKILVSLIAQILLFASLAPAATSERPMLARVDLKQPGAISALRAGDFDIAMIARNDYADIVADDADFKKLQDAGLNPQTIHADLVSFYQSRFPVTATMGGFRTLSEALAYMDTLHALYPDLTTARDSIGYTYQGRAIWMMKISDNPNVDEDEPEFFINGLIHAREPMGMECCLRFMEYLLSNYASDTSVANLVNNREFYFVPIINPDGYEYNRQIAPGGGGMWRKNRHGQGIDLNRNWGYMWGYDNNGSSPSPISETYRGASAFSEPETQSLRNFIDSRHFKLIMNFHAYANDFLYPWGYTTIYTPDQDLFRIMSDSIHAINNYATGTPWERLYLTNGETNDWQYGEQVEKPKMLGTCMEVGNDNDGFWPTPSRIPVIWGEVLPALLYLSRIAAEPYAQVPPRAPILNPIGDIFSDTFTVSWQHSDTLNPATSFELKEYSGLQRLTDDFELNYGYWSTLGFYLDNTRYHSGGYSLFSGAQDNFDATAIRTNTINVNAGDTIQFWTWYDIEPGYDYAYVQLSTDGGITFTNLAGNITTTANPNGQNHGNGITGSSIDWQLAKFPLDNYVGQNVTLALRYITDAHTLGEGFYVDDFWPVEVFQNEIILSSNIPNNYFRVNGRSEGNYFYEVRARDAQGQWSVFSNREEAIVHPLSSVDDPALPLSLSLSQNYPNPFNPTTTIAFTLPRRSQVDLAVYNITGARVATLMNTELEQGNYRVSYNGRDEAGQVLSSGVYFYRLRVDGRILTKKMIFMK
jgi:hypothetical protein